MIIYISHSTNFNFTENLYKPLQEGGFNHDFIFPHDKTDAQYPAKELFISKKCDLVIAEVSSPSTGQGIELGWANDNNISIICLYKKGSLYSKALSLVSEKFFEYTDSSDLVEKIKKVL